MQSCELVASITALACAIAKNNCQENVEWLAAVFVQLGDTLASIALHNEICCGGEDE